jgi:hypothetical protein
MRLATSASDAMRVSLRSFATIAGVLALCYAAAPSTSEATRSGNARFSPLSARAFQLRPDRVTADTIPTLSQLLTNFAVLRRSQTAADHSWHTPPAGPDARSLTRLTRLARTLPDGTRVFLTVERYTGPGWPSVYPVGSYELNIYIVPANANDSFGTNFGPNVNYNVFPLSSSLPPGAAGPGSPAPEAPTWASIIPNGVFRVRWTFQCLGVRCTQRHLTVRVRVHQNVAAATIPSTQPERGSSRIPGRFWQPEKITWYAQGGRMVASFGHSPNNLSAPPFLQTR